MCLLLAVLGWHVHFVVERALKEEFEKRLVTILQADVTALKLWIDAQRGAAGAIASEPDVVEFALGLVRLYNLTGGERQTLLGSGALRRLRERLQPHFERRGFNGFVLIGSDGVHLAAERDELIGYRGLTERGEFVKRTLDGETVISKPFLSLVPLPDRGGTLTPQSPTMFVAAPVRDAKGEVFAALGLRIRPEEDFTRILTVARSGETGETYAFDEEGLLISQSRFDEQLKAIGLLPDRPDARSILNVHIRDPGVNLLREKRPERLRGERPLTRMASSAIRGESGSNVEGYRDYRGVPVIGAWTWLPGHGFGVATEVDVAEAYRPLRILRRAFFALFGLLVAATITILLFSRSILILRGRMRKALSQVERLGQYKIEEKIGGGGLGEVYRASHVLLRRPTALKILRPERHGPEDIHRFEREVQLASRLTHPNTIRIYDFGITPDGIFYFAMEYLPGGDLNRLVELAGPLPESRVIHILLQVCGSLREAHGKGMVHRDVKPGNLILCEHGGHYDYVVVADFGLAKDVQHKGHAGVTDPRFAVGTPRYLSPEAVRTGTEMDARSDLYSLGAVGYFLLTGHDLFETDSVVEIIRRHLTETPVRPSERLGSAVSSDLEAIIMQCLEKDPAARPGTAEEVAKRLSECREAGKWTEDDAREWWEVFGEQMRVRSPERPRPFVRPEIFEIGNRMGEL